MDDASLRADCAHCIGLCCVLLAFDRGPLFGFDKAPGEPCRHLDLDNRCAIHRELAARGFAGCAHYDCLGAGQAVTAMFAGRSWRDDPETMREMYDAFVRVRETNRRRLARPDVASAVHLGEHRASQRVEPAVSSRHPAIVPGRKPGSEVSKPW